MNCFKFKTQFVFTRKHPTHFLGRYLRWLKSFAKNRKFHSSKKKPGPDFSGPGFSPMKHKTSEPIGRIYREYVSYIFLNNGASPLWRERSACKKE